MKFPDLPESLLRYTDQFKSERLHYTTQMYEQLKSLPEQTTIIATGPLTNIALLLINHPDCMKYIKKLVLMGGAIGNLKKKNSFTFNPFIVIADLAVGLLRLGEFRLFESERSKGRSMFRLD